MAAEAILAIILIAAFCTLVAIAAGRPRRRRRRSGRGTLRFRTSQVADARKARQASWFTGRYKGGLTAREWQEARQFPTQRGEKVRSLNEKRIADHLHTRGIRYEYEPDVCGFRPDFLLPDHGIVVEYWGMQARNDAMRKRKTHVYLREGFQLVSLGPGKDVGLETDLRRQLRHKGVPD